LFEHYRNENYTDYRIDHEKKIVEIPRPAGVIFALTLHHNPVCSVFYKALLALLTRNAIVISPHPMAKKCCSMPQDSWPGQPKRRARRWGDPGDRRAGAAHHRPDYEVGPDRRHFATGGSPMVRAAIPQAIPHSASVPAMCRPMSTRPPMVKAAKAYADSKAFDNSIPVHE
jgi:hypothetical protein